MWNEVIDISYYITNYEEGQYSCYRNFLAEHYIRPKVNKALEEHLHVNTSYEILNNITKEVLEASAEMFIYLNHCYDNHHGGEPIWLEFYNRLFVIYHPKQILLVINRLRNTKQGKTADQILNLLQKTWNLTFNDTIDIDDKDFTVFR